MKEDYFLTNIIIYAIYAFYSNKGMVYDGITLKLEHSPYVQIHIKIIPSKFRILHRKNSPVIHL